MFGFFDYSPVWALYLRHQARGLYIIKSCSALMWPWLVWLNQTEVDGPRVCDPERGAHTHTHLHTKSTRCLTFSPHATHTQTHTQNPSWRQTSPSVCVTRLLHSLRQTGEILLVLPCPSQTISLSKHTWAPANPPPTSRARLQTQEI